MIAQSIKALIQTYREYLSKKKSNRERIDTIHVDEVAFKIAQFYERVRNIIDYQEEHLLRKRIIYRALQRRILFGDVSDNLAESLIKEIIRSGHLPNDSIPEEKIKEVRRLILNLRYFLDYIKDSSAKDRSELSGWLIRLSASAIEEVLDPPVKDMLLADTMFHILRSNLVLKDINLPEEEINAQLFIGIQRALLRVDEDQLSYRFLKFTYPEWNKFSSENIDRIAEQLPSIKESVDQHIGHEIGPRFFKLCNHYNTVFYLLSDFTLANEDVLWNFEELAESEEKLQKLIGRAYDKRYNQQKNKLTRLAFFSVLSLFISKVLIAFAIEIPIDKWMGSFSLRHTAINIVFPPILMFLIIALIRMPSKKNRAIVISEVMAVVRGRKKEYILTAPKQKGLFTQGILRFVYVVISVAIFYGMAQLLLELEFSIASTAVFLFFVSLVAATGQKVHNRSKEISMEKTKAGFLSFVFDLVTVPFVTVGKVVIAGLSKFHFLVMLVNFVDLPFQLFVHFIENLSAFIKSKKEEIY